MNKLKLKEYNENHVIYFYQPEGRGEYGEVVYDLKNGDTVVAVRAEGDDCGYYGHKAESKVKAQIIEEYLPLEFIQAWY